MYIYERSDWPKFTWDEEALASQLASVRHQQGRLLGHMEALGFSLQAEANLHTLTLDVLKTSEIEGEILDPEQVRSSIARRLGMNVAGLVFSERHVDGIVEMMLDATQGHKKPLTEERLFSWHAALFPTGRSGMSKIIVGGWRDDANGPMQVVSGPAGREKVHFEALAAGLLKKEMRAFLKWFDNEQRLDPVLKAAIAHLWFVTIHPFEDGNGRIARAIADLQLARADKSAQRFYSMSAQIRQERSDYYNILERTQKGPLDITRWIKWFFSCLERSLSSTEKTLASVRQKARFWEKHKSANFNDRQRLVLNRLLDGFEGKLTSSKWAKLTKVSHDTALRDIRVLIELGVLTQAESGGRSTGYNLSLAE